MSLQKSTAYRTKLFNLWTIVQGLYRKFYFHLWCTPFVLSIVASTALPAHGSEPSSGLFAQPIQQEVWLPDLPPSSVNFVMDFTYSKGEGFKVIEYGGSHISGSSVLDGHRDAYPNLPSFWEFGERAAADFAKKNHIPNFSWKSLKDFKLKDLPPGLIMTEGGETKDGLMPKYERPKTTLTLKEYSADPWVGHKGASRLLDFEKTDNFRPKQGVFNRQLLLETPELRTEFFKFLDLLSSQNVVLKPSSGSRSKGAFLTDKAALKAALQGDGKIPNSPWENASTNPDYDSWIVQEFYPSDRIKKEKLSFWDSKDKPFFSPTGRVYFNVFFDGKTLAAYPVSAYWKIGRDNGFKTPDEPFTPENTTFTAMEQGAPISNSLMRTILPKAKNAAMVILPRLLKLNEIGKRSSVYNNSEIPEEIIADFLRMPKWEQRSLIMSFTNGDLANMLRSQLQNFLASPRIELPQAPLRERRRIR